MILLQLILKLLIFQVHDYMFEFAANNSDIAQVLQIGYSYEGRPFYAVRVSTDQLLL